MDGYYKRGSVFSVTYELNIHNFIIWRKFRI